MMLDTSPPIVKKCYEVIKLLQEQSKQVARFERYTLWQSIQTQMISIYQSIFTIASTTLDKRVSTLQNCSAQLEVIKSLIRLSYESKVIDKKKYVAFQLLLDEVGRMLGGWLKSYRSNSENK